MDSRPSVEQLFQEYMGRREGIIRALTTELEEFLSLCDPDKDLVCLYGHPCGTWDVDVWQLDVPSEKVPSKLPDFILGINFEKDETQCGHSLMKVAIHCHSWLISVAYCDRCHLDKNDRERLFTRINDLPTVIEVLAQHLGFDPYGGNESEESIKVIVDERAKDISELPYENIEVLDESTCVPDEQTRVDKKDPDDCGSDDDLMQRCMGM